jgi:hypothetical protein
MVQSSLVWSSPVWPTVAKGTMVKVESAAKRIQDCLEQVLCKELPTEMTHVWWPSRQMHEFLILRGVHDELKLADSASLLGTLTKRDAVCSRKLAAKRFFQFKGDGMNTAPGHNEPSLKTVATECKFPHDNESLLTVQKLNDALRDRVRHDENKENRPPAMTNQQLPSPASLMAVPVSPLRENGRSNQHLSPEIAENPETPSPDLQPSPSMLATSPACSSQKLPASPSPAPPPAAVSPSSQPASNFNSLPPGHELLPDGFRFIDTKNLLRFSMWWGIVEWHWEIGRIGSEALGPFSQWNAEVGGPFLVLHGS